MTDDPAAPVPDQAVTAAAEAMRDNMRYPAGTSFANARLRELAVIALEAGAPAIREAERQRLAAEIPHGIINTRGEITAGHSPTSRPSGSQRGKPAAASRLRSCPTGPARTASPSWSSSPPTCSAPSTRSSPAPSRSHAGSKP